ncbi:DUF2254 domain-containing protein [Flavisolibacter ginsengisoli]|jgi:uncharacterized membrane protein|nr:DUF2254 family protein [Flavisolibacter ginsengisoli]
MINVMESIFKRLMNRITGSIAFYPVIISFLFLLLFWVMINVDQSTTGKHIKSTWQWLRLKDATAARLIASTIASGMLSFTVFSFSMVMIVLNQTASKMSNRILEIIIRNRFQQIVLGCYIGTVIFSIFLITTIRDTDSGIYVPALSTYVLILLAVVDIFLFIYFLHFVTQYAKYQTIIRHIHSQTLKRLSGEIKNGSNSKVLLYNIENSFTSPKTGYFEGYNKKAMHALPISGAYHIHFLYSPGSFILKDATLYLIKSNDILKAEIITKVEEAIEIESEPSLLYFLSGFNQLSEVALKALSPGINDPATAILCLQAMADLFSWILKHSNYNEMVDEQENSIISHKIPGIEEMLTSFLLPVWDYGKEDRIIQISMMDLIQQLLSISCEVTTTNWLTRFFEEVKMQSLKGYKP